MTYVEFFDNEVAENISACAAIAPDRVILIGKDRSPMEIHAQRYRRVFSSRGITTMFEVRTVNVNSLPDIVEKLTAIVEEHGDCAFDLTGGDDLMLVAMGIVFERYRNQEHVHLQMHRFNLRSNRVYDCDADGNILFETQMPAISVEENIQIFGGVIRYDSAKEAGTRRWQLTADDMADLQALWECCLTENRLGSVDVRAWNAQVWVFKAAEENSKDPASLETIALLSDVKAYLKQKNADYTYIPCFINELKKRKLAVVNVNETTIRIRYKNPLVKYCLTKAGQTLEMYVYMLACQATEADGQPTYNDVMTGVQIDWDGKLLLENPKSDTENEIDVLMMHGMIPVFISCKNGEVTVDELYKLQTVAVRFGGKYARKYLVVTALGENESAKTFRLRAADMNIKLIEPLKETPGAFAKAIRGAWRS